MREDEVARDKCVEMAKLLTPSLVRVVERLVMGERASDIAETLELSMSTVQHYLHDAKIRTGAMTLPHLAAICVAGKAVKPVPTPEQCYSTAQRLDYNQRVLVRKLAAGYSHRKLGLELGVSEKTVQQHIGICRKLVGCRTSPQLVAVCVMGKVVAPKEVL